MNMTQSISRSGYIVTDHTGRRAAHGFSTYWEAWDWAQENGAGHNWFNISWTI